MDVAATLVKNVLCTRYEDLPSEAVKITKQHVLHTLAALIAGSSGPGCKAVVDMVKEWQGKAESTVLVYGGKVPAADAALTNAVMAHALDYDVCDDRTYYKPSITVVPVSLAVAELKGGLTGKDFIAAVCTGEELGIRIGLAANPKPAHAFPFLVGCLASAAVAAKILGLTEEQMLDALGIAYCQLSPTGLSVRSPALTKRLKAGLTARAGVFSALLARRGFTSIRNVLQGPKGYYMSFHGEEGDLEGLTADPGKGFEMVNVGLKGHPCCAALDVCIDATLELVNEHNITPDDVEAVVIRRSYKTIPMLADEMTPEVLETRRHPRGVVDAQFSTPWVVATAIVKKSVFIEDFTEVGVGNLEVQRMADRVTLVDDPQLGEVGRQLTPAVAEIKTKNGRVFSKRVDFPKGNPRNPVSMDETAETFRMCAAYAAKPIPAENVDRAIEIVCNLEVIDDIGKLTSVLVA